MLQFIYHEELSTHCPVTCIYKEPRILLEESYKHIHTVDSGTHSFVHTQTTYIHIHTGFLEEVPTQHKVI